MGKKLWLGAVATALVASTGCQTNFGGMTLPSPRYLEHQPQYFPADPVFPLPRELATQTDPAGAGGAIGLPGGANLVPPAVPVPVVQPGPGGPAPGVGVPGKGL
jgi:hypothetical protein